MEARWEKKAWTGESKLVFIFVCRRSSRNINHIDGSNILRGLWSVDVRKMKILIRCLRTQTKVAEALSVCFCLSADVFVH